MLLSIYEVQKELRVSRHTIYRWLNTPDLHFPRPIKLSPSPTGAIRFRREEIESWLETRERTTPQVSA